MPELAGVNVFEVDHPATQGDKKARLAELPRATGIVSFVSVDFERESLGAALDRTEHDRSAPTCWIWEGVVMYLSRDAMRDTLAGVAARSASGSTLIVNYNSIQRRLLARLVFRLIGEPMISSSSPDEIAADMRAVGFVVFEDSGIFDWNARFAEGRAKVERRSFVRIAIART
jgi:methyltransferase (TIGR00027 family)